MIIRDTGINRPASSTAGAAPVFHQRTGNEQAHSHAVPAEAVTAEQAGTMMQFLNQSLINIDLIRYGCSFPRISSLSSPPGREESGKRVVDDVRPAEADKHQINNILESTAARYGIPPVVLKAIAWQETFWKPDTIGDHGKSFGMMQVHTPAHPDYNVEKGKESVAYNVDYAARYLRQLYDQCGNWEKAVERYNGSGKKARRYAASVKEHIREMPWLTS